MIQVRGPDGAVINFPDGTPQAAIQNALARHYGGEGSNATFAPAPGVHPAGVLATADPRGPAGAHPQGQDWWRSTLGGLAQGVNATAAPVGAAYDTEDRLAEMAAHGIHDAGQTLGWVPKGQAYKPGQGASLMHTLRDPAELTAAAAGMFGADQKTQQGVRDAIHTVGAVGAPGTAWSHLHPSDVRNTELAAALAAGGQNAARQVADVVDYQPQTALGRVLHRTASTLPAAGLPGSLTQRALAVAAPAAGMTLGGEGARALGFTPQAASDAEMIAGLLSAGAGGKAIGHAENAVMNVGDIARGPRAVPTSGSVADLAAMLGGDRGGAGQAPPFSLSDLPDIFLGRDRPGGAAPAEDAATFKQSDLQGAGKILRQHVARVGRASGEDFGAMAGRVGGMGDQAMLADALQDLGRNVADRGSFGQQFLGKQLNERQFGVMDPATGDYSQPSAAMRLDAARRAALGVNDGAFATTEALTQAQRANAGPLYTAAHAQAPESADSFSTFSQSPLWNEAYNRARGLSQVQIVDLPGGGKGIQALPETMPDALDWRTLDLMKQGIQDKISENARQGMGAHEQGALKGYLDLLTQQQNALNPTLGDARAAYAGPAQVKDAIGFGRDAFTMDPAELASELSKMNPADRQGANVGYYQAGRDATLGKDQGINAARVLGANTPDMMARNRAFMGDNFVDWNTLLGNENTFNATKNRVVGGSLTSRNSLGAEDAADIEGVQPVDALAGAIRAAHLEPDGLVETAGNVGKLAGIAKLFAPRSPQMTEGTADVLGTILGTRGALADPQTADLIQALMDSAKTSPVNFGIAKPAAVLSAPQGQDQGNQ